MKNRKQIILILFSVFTLHPVFTEEKSFWSSVINEALSNTPEYFALKNQKQAGYIYYLDHKLSWIPSIVLDFPQKLNVLRGESVPVVGGLEITDYVSLFSFSASAGIAQKLPGNGFVYLNTGYNLNYLKQTNGFLQLPYFSVTYEQSLGYGIFGIGGNPETVLVNENYNYNNLKYEKALFDEIAEIVNAIRDYDCQNAEEVYYQKLLTLYELKSSENEILFSNGTVSNQDAFRAKQELINLKHKILIANYENNSIATTMKLKMPEVTADEIESHRTEILDFITITVSETEKSIDLKLLEIDANRIKETYKKNEINYSPVFYFQGGLSPDTNFYYRYSDWYKSWRMLNTRPYPANISFTTGIDEFYD